MPTAPAVAGFAAPARVTVALHPRVAHLIRVRVRFRFRFRFRVRVRVRVSSRVRVRVCSDEPPALDPATTTEVPPSPICGPRL